MSTTRIWSWRWSASPAPSARSEETNRRFSVFRAEKIAKNLGVRNDEVAILALSTAGAPALFGAGGLEEGRFYSTVEQFGPRRRTARDSRPEIENNFAPRGTRTVFEGVNSLGKLPKRFTR